MKDALLAKFRDRTARIGVIGQGYVGLPLALVFARPASRSPASTSTPRKIAALRRGESYIKHIGAERVAAAVTSGRFDATTDFDGSARLRRHHHLRADAARAATASRTTPTSTRPGARSRSACGRGSWCVLESTTYPGTTDEELQPILETSGLRCARGLPPGLLAGARGPGPQATSTPRPSRRWWAA